MAEGFVKLDPILEKIEIQTLQASTIQANANILEGLKAKITVYKEEILQKHQHIDELNKANEANKLKIRKFRTVQLLHQAEEQQSADLLINRNKEVEALGKESQRKVDNLQSMYLKKTKLVEDSLPESKELVKTETDNDKLMFELNPLEAKIKNKQVQLQQIKEFEKKKLSTSILPLLTTIRENEEQCMGTGKNTTRSDTLLINKPGVQAIPGFKISEIPYKKSVMKQNLGFEDWENAKMSLSERSPKYLDSKTEIGIRCLELEPKKKFTPFGVLSDNNSVFCYPNIPTNITNNEPPEKKKKIVMEFTTSKYSSNNIFEVNNEYPSPSLEMDWNSGSPKFDFEFPPFSISD